MKSAFTEKCPVTSPVVRSALQLFELHSDPRYGGGSRTFRFLYLSLALPAPLSVARGSSFCRIHCKLVSNFSRFPLLSKSHFPLRCQSYSFTHPHATGSGAHVQPLSVDILILPRLSLSFHRRSDPPQPDYMSNFSSTPFGSCLLYTYCSLYPRIHFSCIPVPLLPSKKFHQAGSTQYYSTPFTIIHASFCLVISARNFCSLFASLSNSRTGLVYDLLNWQKFNFRVPRRWS